MTGRLGAWEIYSGAPQAVYLCNRSVATTLTLNICNRNNGSAFVSVAISTSATAPSNAEWIEYNVELLGKGVLERTGIVVSPGQYLIVRSNIERVSAVCWGVEMGDVLVLPPIEQNLGTPPVWVTSSIPNVTARVSNYTQLEVTDPDNGTVTYSVTSGDLPTGISLSETGVLSGVARLSSYTVGATPTTNVTITANDSQNSVPRTFSIGTQWLDGSTAARAASSAQDIRDLAGASPNQYYWINLGGTPRQVFCDMSDATAWMMAMRCANGGSTFGWSSAYWTNLSGLNETANPLTDTDIKNQHIWNNWTISQMRITGSQSATACSANPITFGTFQSTLFNIFNSGNNIYNEQINIGRGAWINWANSACGTVSSYWDNQPNCNEDRINGYWTYHAVRIGISFNNEGDCNTNDSGVGFGQYRNGLTDLSSGAVRWNPDTRYGCHGWVWVR